MDRLLNLPPTAQTLQKLKDFRKLLETDQREAATRESDRFAQYVTDPIGFVEKVLAGFIWSKQREICLSVRDNRRTAVKSCHDVGKSAVAARIAAWWVATHKPGEAFVVTSAPTFNQVRAILWREMNKVHRAGRLPGQMNQTEWFLNSELVAFGRSPADTDPTAFQGIHARYVLVIFDEACGIATALWEAAETLVANDESRILAIGNPDDPSAEFARACKPGSGYNTIRINAFDSPNFTGEKVPDWLPPLLVGKTWVEERRKKWGETSPLWISKVTGDFPEQSVDGLIPLSALRAAIDRELEPGEPNELGVDVARYGSAWTVIYHRRGGVARCFLRFQNRDLMYTCGQIVMAIRETKATAVKIDDAGLGGGVTDRLRELWSEGQIKANIVGINVGWPCQTMDDAERFQNLRAQLNWNIRDLFVDGKIDIDDNEDLLSQAVEVKYKPGSAGRIKLESKEDAAKRGIPSPDDWDALVLAFASDELGREQVFSAQQIDVVIDSIPLPRHYRRVFGIDVTRARISVIWGAHDPHANKVYLYEEYSVRRGDLAVHAAAIMKRGSWIPGIIEPEARGRNQDEGERLVERLMTFKMDLFEEIDGNIEACIEEMNGRISAATLHVFRAECPEWIKQYRNYRRDHDGELREEDDGLIHATGLLCARGLEIAITDHNIGREGEMSDEVAAQGKNDHTGY